MKQYYVYILASKPGGILYIGFTSDLIKRSYQHREHVTEGFTKKYFVRRLIYYEIYEDPTAAITREKQLKKWNRDWKIELIERENPQWLDLWPTIV